ncbi:MAG: hypothetical protein JJ992_24265 [Planctomycetes bacterium]|nr:hypothetical protein [Planctomycetota bacterium]
MRFLVTVQSPRTPCFQAAGDWLIEAENREMALAVVKDRADSRWWPVGSVWTVQTRSEEDAVEHLRR